MLDPSEAIAGSGTLVGAGAFRARQFEQADRLMGR
jgi:hypothetical protein